MNFIDYMALMFGDRLSDAAISIATPSRPTEPAKAQRYHSSLDVSCSSAWVSQALSTDGSVRDSSLTEVRIFCLDDIGTKVPVERVAHLVPTVVLETSPGNFQYHFRVTGERCADRDYVKALRQAVSDANLSDPGVRNFGHLIRVPGALNRKDSVRAANGGQSWRVRVTQSSPDATYTLEALAEHLGVAVVPPQREPVSDAHNGSGTHYYDRVAAMLEARGMVQGTSDFGHFVSCPFEHEHTDKRSNRTELKEPSDRNNWHGALVCPHGHCISRSPRHDGNILSTVFNQVYLGSPEHDAERLALLKDLPPEFQVLPPPDAEGAFADVMTLEEFTRRFAWVEAERSVYDSKFPREAPRSWEVFRDAFASSRDGKMAVAQQWMNGDKQRFHHRTFDPSRPTVFFERGFRTLNTYVPVTFPVVEQLTPEAERFMELLRFLTPEPLTLTRTRTGETDVIPGWEFMCEYIADMLQNPGVRPHCHVLLISQKEGTGRSTLFNTIANLLGDYGRRGVDLQRDILGTSFNTKMSQALGMFVEETEVRGEMRYDSYGALKSLLSDQTITVNEKNSPRHTEKCVARYFMATNSLDAIAVADTDRRLVVMRCPDEPKAKDWYDPLHAAAEVSSGRTPQAEQTLASLYTYFMRYEIKYLTAGTRAASEAKEDMKAAVHWGASGEVRDMVAGLPHGCITVRDAKVLLGHLAASELRLMGKFLLDCGMRRSTRQVKVDGRPEGVYYFGNLDTDKVRLTHEWVKEQVAGKVSEEFGFTEL